jgi:hypothetical protein
MFNWSDPSQSQETAAKLQSSFQPQQAQIGTIIAALLQQKYHQQELEQQQQQDLIKGLGSVAAGVGKSYQSGQADDAANAALYGAQNPSDAMGGYTDPNRVPDYGGQDALKAYLLQQKAATNPLDDQLTQSKINAENALASNRWTYPQGSGSGDSGMTPRQNINTLKDAQGAAGDAFDEYGLSPSAMNDSNVHAPSDTPAVYSKGAPATTVPQGQYLVVDPADGSYHYVAQDYFNQARGAQDAYKQAQQQYRGALNAPTPQAAPTVSSPPTAGSTDAHAQAVKILQDNGKPVTEANIAYVMQQLIK